MFSATQRPRCTTVNFQYTATYVPYIHINSKTMFCKSLLDTVWLHQVYRKLSKTYRPWHIFVLWTHFSRGGFYPIQAIDDEEILLLREEGFAYFESWYEELFEDGVDPHSTTQTDSLAWQVNEFALCVGVPGVTYRNFYAYHKFHYRHGICYASCSRDS